MAGLNNVFISHYGEDEKQLDTLKQRLRDHGCDARNSSVEKKKYRPYKVTDATIARYLRICIRWAKTFIVMIGEHTHERPWVNYEIRQAARQGKTIIGVYEHGCKDDVELLYSKATRVTDFASDATGIEDVMAEGGVTVMDGIYDLSGRKLDVRSASELRRGIYVVSRNGKTQKVLVK